MRYPRDILDAAHRHSSDHRAELDQSSICGCFHCCNTCAPEEIEEWVNDDKTALCPNCGIDSVIGSASGYPVHDEPFLTAMRERWF